MGVCNVPLVDKVCDAVGGVVEKTGQAITNGIGAWIAQSMGELAASSADLAARAVDTTTAVDLNASWFRSNYELLLPIGLVLIVATFCAQLVRAAIRRDERALAQAVTGTVVGIAFQFGAIAFTSVALTVVDALSSSVWAASGTNVEAAVRRIVQVSTFGAMFPLGWAVPALVALVLAICMFIYWGVMVFRKVAILILVTLAVFAGAGGGWEAARRWRRGWVEATATLVVSKLLMTIVFALGVAAMGQSNSNDGLAALSDAMAGVVVMCLVLCCPLITFKFVHWAGESSNGADLTTSAGAGAAMAWGASKKAGNKAKSMMAPATGAPAFAGASNGVATGIPAGGSALGSPTQTSGGTNAAQVATSTAARIGAGAGAVAAAGQRNQTPAASGGGSHNSDQTSTPESGPTAAPAGTDAASPGQAAGASGPPEATGTVPGPHSPARSAAATGTDGSIASNATSARASGTPSTTSSSAAGPRPSAPPRSTPTAATPAPGPAAASGAGSSTRPPAAAPAPNPASRAAVPPPAPPTGSN